MYDLTTETTTLTEIRDFLRREGHAPAPWSTPHDAVEQLYETLRRRREDEAFWVDLRWLAGRLEDRRFVAARAPGGQALGPAVTERLLAELRSSLPPLGGAPHPILEWLSGRATATALAGFLLLGVATGCSDDGSQCRGDAEAHGYVGEEATVYNALVEYVDETDFTHAEKCTIYECLPEMDAASREAMLDIFQTLSEEELAWRLDSLLDHCEELEEDDDDDDCDDGCH